MSSSLQAELQANDINVRDFSNIDSQQQQPTAPCEHADTEQNPSREAGQKGRGEEEEGSKEGSNPSTTTATAQDPTTATLNRQVKLPYSRFYSPHWTSPYQPPQGPMPAPPLSTQNPAPPHPSLPPQPSSFTRSSAAVNRHLSDESTTSFGSQYSTMPSYEQSPQHYRGRRRTATSYRVSSRHTSDESGFSTDEEGGR